MKPGNIEAIYRLTPLQEGLLYHTLESPSSGAYFDQYTAAIKGGIDVELFTQAWEDLVAQHAALRTFFTWEKREHPLQVVRKSAELPIERVDLSGQSESDQQQAIKTYLDDDRKRGFVLDQAPLLRVRLTDLGGGVLHLAWSFHHLILDGWSVRLLLTELQQRYQSLSAGRTHVAKTGPSFEQFVSWQRQADADAANRFWSGYLNGFALPSTPRVGTVSDRQDHKASMQTRLTLPQDLQETLAKFARQSRVTLNTLFVAAWGLVLGRYCDQNDVVFGTTSAGRPPAIEGIDRTAGLFITTLPVRVNLDPQQPVGDFLTSLQKDQSQQREFDYVGLNVIQKASDVPPGVPLFETILVFENFPEFAESGDAGFELSDEDFIEYSHYPLAILVVPGATTELIAVHQPGQYSARAVGNMLANLVTALRELTSKKSVDHIDVLSLQEREYVFEQGTGQRIPVEPCSVLDEFERRVAQGPDAIAIAVGDELFSYADIDARANCLARQLQTGDCRDSRAVVIVCERNQWAIVAQLASLKARKVYVTLDSKDPDSRIDYVLNDVAAAFSSEGDVAVPILVTTEQQNQSRSDLRKPHRLLLAEQAEAGAETTGTTKAEKIEPETPAYVIYTSGSTGRPKGVLVSHGSLINSTMARHDFYPGSPVSFALLSSLATDSSIAGIFWTLCTGGTLVMPAERAELDVGAMLQLFNRRAVTHTLCVPSLYGLMLDALASEPVPTLEAVVVAGEACPLSLVRRHYHETRDIALYNEYGPSEACVWVTAALLRDEDASVSIGKPISNTRALVLDSEQRPVPAGVIGELYVGGANLATEYINHAEATASSFQTLLLPDPQRFYRTGDKVVLNERSQLEYMGRVDNQLKIRGFRVEPGEVEAALSRHDDIDAAVVLVDDSDVEAVLIDSLTATQSVDPGLLERMLGDIEALTDADVEQALSQLSRGVESTSND